MEIEKFKALEEANWKQIGKTLLGWSHSWSGKYPQLGCGVNRELALGITHEDIVKTVIKKTITGERNWDPEKGSLESWLIDQVKSEISNLAGKAATLSETLLLEVEAEEGALDRQEYQVRSLPDPIFALPKTPEEALLTKEQIEQEAEWIMEGTDGDPEMERLLDAILESHSTKPAELAPILGVQVDDVYRQLRKFRRRINKLKKETLVQVQAKTN